MSAAANDQVAAFIKQSSSGQSSSATSVKSVVPSQSPSANEQVATFLAARASGKSASASSSNVGKGSDTASAQTSTSNTNSSSSKVAAPGGMNVWDTHALPAKLTSVKHAPTHQGRLYCMCLRALAGNMDAAEDAQMKDVIEAKTAAGTVSGLIAALQAVAHTRAQHRSPEENAMITDVMVRGAAAAASGATVEIMDYLRSLNDMLSDTNFVIGNTLTVADAYVWAAFRDTLAKLPHAQRQHIPAVYRWAALMQSLPALEATAFPISLTHIRC